MPIEHIILALCILFGLMLIKISWSKFKNKQFFRGWLNFSLGIFTLSISSIFLTLVIDYDTFQRLTREHPVASIAFHNLGQHHYQAILTPLNQTKPEPIFLELHGDQWQLDVKMIKWNGAAAWSGLKPMFQLDRIAGRYNDIELEKSATRSVFSLEQSFNPSLWHYLIEYQAFIPWLDAYYGSATYMPMSHGAIFEVTISATGLIARPSNEVAKQAALQWVTL